MRGLSLLGLTVLLQSHLTYGEPVNAREVGDKASIEGRKVTYQGEDGFWESFSCNPNGDTVMSLSSDKKYAACCPTGNTLQGSPDTEWHCCATGHELTGSEDVGFECCVKGSTFDGEECKRDKKKTCENGKVLIDGECQCPDGKEELEDGTCEAEAEGECESGVETGKCYFFTGRSGEHLSFNRNQYSEHAQSKYIRPGKFQFCLDEECKGGLPVDPSSKAYIKDLHGRLPAGGDAGQWVADQKNGAHIGKTPDFSKAGEFSITKWPCGKYCLTGFTEGLRQACPDGNPGITLDGRVPDSCIEFELTEVPCDIRAAENNCIWKNGDQCCNKLDCSNKA